MSYLYLSSSTAYLHISSFLQDTCFVYMSKSFKNRNPVRSQRVYHRVCTVLIIVPVSEAVLIYRYKSSLLLAKGIRLIFLSLPSTGILIDQLMVTFSITGKRNAFIRQISKSTNRTNSGFCLLRICDQLFGFLRVISNFSLKLIEKIF